jgi:hypothetical protein
VADPVPEEAGVAVRRVLGPGQAVRRQVGEDGRAAHPQQGPDQPAAPARDAGEPPGPGALEQAHEDGFRLVVRRVGQGDAVRARLARQPAQRREARGPGRLLRRAAPAAGHHDPRLPQGHAEPPGHGGDQGGVGVGLRPQAVVDVAGDHGHAERRRQDRQGVEQGHRVGAAGHAHEHAVPAREQPVAGHGSADGLDQRALDGGPVQEPLPRPPRRPDDPGRRRGPGGPGRA